MKNEAIISTFIVVEILLDEKRSYNFYFYTVVEILLVEWQRIMSLMFSPWLELRRMPRPYSLNVRDRGDIIPDLEWRRWIEHIEMEYFTPFLSREQIWQTKTEKEEQKRMKAKLEKDKIEREKLRRIEVTKIEDEKKVKEQYEEREKHRIEVGKKKKEEMEQEK